MKQKIFTYLLLLFLSSCGYEALYSKKNKINYNFSISELDFVGNREINLKIKEKLNNQTLSQKDNDFKLKISSTSKKLILVKNDLGDATKFKIQINTEIEVMKNRKLKINCTRLIIIMELNRNYLFL